MSSPRLTNRHPMRDLLPITFYRTLSYKLITSDTSSLLVFSLKYWSIIMQAFPSAKANLYLMWWLPMVSKRLCFPSHRLAPDGMSSYGQRLSLECAYGPPQVPMRQTFHFKYAHACSVGRRCLSSPRGRRCIRSELEEQESIIQVSILDELHRGCVHNCPFKSHANLESQILKPLSLPLLWCVVFMCQL